MHVPLLFFVVATSGGLAVDDIDPRKLQRLIADDERLARALNEGVPSARSSAYVHRDRKLYIGDPCIAPDDSEACFGSSCIAGDNCRGKLRASTRTVYFCCSCRANEVLYRNSICLPHARLHRACFSSEQCHAVNHNTYCKFRPTHGNAPIQLGRCERKTSRSPILALTYGASPHPAMPPYGYRPKESYHSRPVYPPSLHYPPPPPTHYTTAPPRYTHTTTPRYQYEKPPPAAPHHYHPPPPAHYAQLADLIEQLRNVSSTLQQSKNEQHYPTSTTSAYYYHNATIKLGTPCLNYGQCEAIAHATCSRSACAISPENPLGNCCQCRAGYMPDESGSACVSVPHEPNGMLGSVCEADEDCHNSTLVCAASAEECNYGGDKCCLCRAGMRPMRTSAGSECAATIGSACHDESECTSHDSNTLCFCDVAVTTTPGFGQRPPATDGPGCTCQCTIGFRPLANGICRTGTACDAEPCQGDPGAVTCIAGIAGDYECKCNGPHGVPHNRDSETGICCMGDRRPCPDLSGCYACDDVCDSKPDCADCFDEEFCTAGKPAECPATTTARPLG